MFLGERWRVQLYHAGALVFTSANFYTREAAENWGKAVEPKRSLDVQLWCRERGELRFKATTFGWSAESSAS